MDKALDIFCDGACSGNPGPAAIGVIMKENGQVVREISHSIGSATNNIAEYFAFVTALQEALILKAARVCIHTDSELLYHQIKGNYKVKNSIIKLFFELARHLLAGFERVEVLHIPREKNAEADRLAKKAIKKEQAKVVAPKSLFGEESPSSQG